MNNRIVFDEFYRWCDPTTETSMRLAEHDDQSTDEAEECPLCGGSGGWPGPQGRVVCKPCRGTGKRLA